MEPSRSSGRRSTLASLAITTVVVPMLMTHDLAAQNRMPPIPEDQWTEAQRDAHHALALRGGLAPEIAVAVAEGRRPDGMAADEAAVYDFCMELHRNRSVSDATYAHALAQLGEQGIMDVIGLSGWYTLVSMVLNTARVPLPSNAPQQLEPFSR